MQAACGLAQLERLDGFVQARKSNHAKLSAMLADMGFDQFGQVQKPIEEPGALGLMV